MGRSLADFNAAIRAAPSYANAFYGRGLAHIKKHDYASALADFDETIRLKPDHHLAFIGRGNVHLTEGRVGQAVADYNEDIRLNPAESVAFASRGVDQKLGDKQSAAADAAEARRLRGKQ